VHSANYDGGKADEAEVPNIEEENEVKMSRKNLIEMEFLKGKKQPEEIGRNSPVTGGKGVAEQAGIYSGRLARQPQNQQKQRQEFLWIND
jgi:hypothetical protein